MFRLCIKHTRAATTNYTGPFNLTDYSHKDLRSAIELTRKFSTRNKKQSIGLGSSATNSASHDSKINEFYNDNKLERRDTFERLSVAQYARRRKRESTEQKQNLDPNGREGYRSLRDSNCVNRGNLQQRRLLHERLALDSYLDVCVDVKQTQRAHNTLTAYLNRNTQPPRRLITLKHYNIVIRGWAKEGSWADIMELRWLMKRNKVKPDLETVAYMLLASSSTPGQTKDRVDSVLEDIEAHGMNLAHIFQACYLSPKERNSLRSLIKREIDPNYKDIFCDDPIEYNCKLLKNFHETPSEPYEFTGLADFTRINYWAQEQMNIESKVSIPIRSVAKVNEAGLRRYGNIWKKLKEIWHQSLSAKLDESLTSLEKQSEDTKKIHLYPYLCSIDKNVLIDLMMDVIETNATASSFSASTNSLHLWFGRKVMTNYLRSKAVADGSMGEVQQIYKDYLSEYITNPDLMSKMNPREYIQIKARDTENYGIYRDRLTNTQFWPDNVTTAVGRLCYGIILRSVKFDPSVIRNSKNQIDKKNLVYAFYTAYFQLNGGYKIKEEFRAHQDFDKLYQRSSSMRLRFDYSFLPSLCPPFPWLSRVLGGYLTNKTDVVRLSEGLEKKEIDVRDGKSQIQKLYPSLDSLNAIGICPWIVNKEVLDIVIKIFQSGGNTDLSVPIDQSRMDKSMPRLKENPSKADRIKYNAEKRKHDQKKREMYSLWRDCLYRLTIANHYRHRIIWFPHNMDFRGRTYPVPPHFNHLGADLGRSLLLFAKGRPLGDKGLDWLKLHLVNLIGTMKSYSLKERLEYVNSILHVEVLDSADNPLDGRRWWMNNENPWQVLACCKEIAKAIRSRNHKEYVCHFPIHQDGSCNGLQHYAALARDPIGAKAVNLTPCDKPQDVYSHVVDICEKLRAEDASKGHKMAQMLEGFIQRKVIKQTVMTNVYGVTRYGARQQIARQLSAKGFSERDTWAASNYLTVKTFESIGQMFNRSRDIQTWLNQCARIIATRCRQPVSWETPLGLPVIQPYMLPPKTMSSKLLSETLGDLSLTDMGSRLNALKQKTAFPPNYIHSLDSSHMMLTSLHSQRQGITFVSVHDCYWTHPSTVDIMNRICREQFILLHSQPLLENLGEQFSRQFGRYLPTGKGQSPGVGGSINQSSSLSLPSEAVREALDDDENQHNSSLDESDEVTDQVGIDGVEFRGSLYSTGDPFANDDDVDNSINNIKQTYLKGNRGLGDLHKSLDELSIIATQDFFKNVPKRGEFDLKLVMDSTYFFS